MVSQQFPNIAATSFPGVAGTTLDQNAFVAPGAPVVGTVGAAAGPSWGSLTAEQLASVIAYQNARLGQLDIPTMQGNLAVQNRQLDVNADQFNRQLFFNEQAQRASELQAYRSLQAQSDAAERARQTTQMTSNFGAATQALSAADEMARQRNALAASSYGQAGQLGLAGRAQAASAYGQAGQLEAAGLDRALGGYGQAAAANLGLRNLSASSYGQAEQLRQGLIDKALQTANLVASLRGPSNAFKQLEVNGYLGGTGAGSLLGALAGGVGVPAYRGLGGTPEAATLGTMARDAGSAVPTGGGDAFADSAGIQGLLGLGAGAASGESPDVAAMREAAQRAMAPSVDAASLRSLGAAQASGETADTAGLRALAAQNAGAVPSVEGKPLDQFAQMMAIARMNQEAGQQVLGAGYGPGSDFGAQVMRDYQQALAATGESYMGADDPRLINMYRNRSGNLISEAQARKLTHYAEDYFRTYGQPVVGGMLNEMLGQVMAGGEPDLTTWSDANKNLVPGWGTPGFKSPPTPWSPGQVPPQGAGQPPPAGQTTPVGPPPMPYTPSPTPVLPAAPGQQSPPISPAPPPGAAPLPPIAPPPTPPPPVRDPNVQNPPGTRPNPSPLLPPSPTPAQPPGAAPTAGATPEWVQLPDGRGAYRNPATGVLFDGSGALLGNDPEYATWTPYYGQRPPGRGDAGQRAADGATQGAQAQSYQGWAAPESQQSTSPFTAPGPAPAQPAGPSQPAQQPTYTFDYLPGGKGLGYLGTDGKMFSATWDPL